MTSEVRIPVPGAALLADLTVPLSARGVVVFAHGSGSGRHSPRNRYVAGELGRAGFATVLADLLTAQEERLDATTGTLRFDIGLLATRLVAVTDWTSGYRTTAGLDVGVFGASTGAAAALIAAAQRAPTIRAVVSRGGRPDLASGQLKLVRQPTLLIVGERDPVVLDLNRAAFDELAATEKRVEVVPGASHLFEESGALEEVAQLARDWYNRYLAPE